MVRQEHILVYMLFIALTQPRMTQPKKAKLYFPLAQGICHQYTEFESTSVLQPPLKKPINSGRPSNSPGDVTWQDCNASKNCHPFSFSSSAVSTVDSELLNKLKQQQIANILIILKDSTDVTLNEIKSRNLKTRAEKLNEAAKAFKAFTANSQKRILELLSRQERTKSLKFRAFWITNKISVEGADLALVQELAKLPEISKIREEPFIKLEPRVNATNSDNSSEIQWGVQTIKAPEVWALGIKGEGITVGVVDTGIMGSHEALKDGFAGEYGWLDPFNNKTAPYDTDGHGTHVTGTIVGSKRGIGVAPGAKWAGCIGCGPERCTLADLITCAQFMACPTKADGTDPKCEKAAHVVNFSWGGAPGGYWYYEAMQYYQVVGIVPIFSIGNEGSQCSSAGSPGDYNITIGVGLSDDENKVVSYSSAGPAVTTGIIKPDVTAPGLFIYSAYYVSDTGYDYMSGSSCACPHVSGAVALILSKYPTLTYEQVKEVLERGCGPTKHSKYRENCGNITQDTYPNNEVGYGIINVLKSIEIAASIT